MVAVLNRSNVTTKKPRVVFYVSEEIKKKLEILAGKHKRSVSNYLEVLVEQEIEKAEQEGLLEEESS
jgi:predicted transcriptional regulator